MRRARKDSVQTLNAVWLAPCRHVEFAESRENSGDLPSCFHDATFPLLFDKKYSTTNTWMRIHLRLSTSTNPVPFDHLHRLLGVLHRWLGPDNPEHDAMSLYSMGWLQGGKVINGALQFPHGASWILGFHGYDPTRRLTEGILQDPRVFCGLRVQSMEKIPMPAFRSPHTFRVGSPVIARMHRPDRTVEYVLWDDPRADAALTATLRAKLEAAGFTGPHLDAEVSFDRSYRRARPKLIAIKGTKHKGSLCPVILTGTPEVLAFAWTCGVGELTGSGFGALQ